MKRRTLDFLFSIGGVGLAVLLLGIGIVLTSNANFANNYVTDQLAQQKITFKTVDTLTAEEKKADCLVRYAGQSLTTGKQAECYANALIGLHLKSIGGGRTYAELGAPQTQLREQLATAKRQNASNVAELQKQVDDITTQRETVFKGETLRGLLLTSYGFSEFGRKADQGALALYLGAVLLFLLSIGGFLHAWRTPDSTAFAAPAPTATPVPAEVQDARSAPAPV